MLKNFCVFQRLWTFSKDFICPFSRPSCVSRFFTDRVPLRRRLLPSQEKSTSRTRTLTVHVHTQRMYYFRIKFYVEHLRTVHPHLITLGTNNDLSLHVCVCLPESRRPKGTYVFSPSWRPPKSQSPLVSTRTVGSTRCWTVRR